MSDEALSAAELARLDALIDPRQSAWWDQFFADRNKRCPFFVTLPDESLVQAVGDGRKIPGRALELGCGNGRNAICLARQGYAVDAVDFSQTALDWAAHNVAEAGVTVRLIKHSVTDLVVQPGSYDLVYDSGCFHHLAPHRRRPCVALVRRALAVGGWFGLSCFRPEGGSGFTDAEVYERGSLGGGLGYTEAQLREIWSHGFEVRELRPMAPQRPESGLFGEAFLWALWAQKL